MDELRERIGRDLERIEPSDEALERTLGLVRRRHRMRAAAAGAVGLLLFVALVAGLWASLEQEGGSPAVDSSPPPVVPPPDRLFLSGDGEAWVVDVASGETTHLDMPELSPGDPPHRVVRRDGVLVAWGYRTLVLDPDEDWEPRVLAPDSLIFIPSAAEDRVWVGIQDEERPERGLEAIRELSVSGEVTVPDVTPPNGAWPVAAVNQGVVLQQENELLVWDPRTGTEIDRLPAEFPLAWQGDRVAWCEDDACQEVHITDVASGDEVVVPCPPGTHGFQAYVGAFSPDGSTLALSIRLDRGEDGREALALIDLETGEPNVVDGTTVEPAYVFVDWSPSGESVFITGGTEPTERVLIEHRPADGTTRTIPAQVGAFYGMAAI